MGRKLAPLDAELYRRVDEVLHYIWDPIGIAGEPGTRDEYHRYLPQVYALLKSDADNKQIEDYLLSVEKDCMGLSVNAAARECSKRVVKLLKEWKEWQPQRDK